MILTILISTIAGYILARLEIIQRLLVRFRFKDYPSYVEEDIAEIMEEEPQKPEWKGINITIWKKHRKTKADKYYPEKPQRLLCDYITFKDGKLICGLKDSMLDEEYTIKDIDEFII